LLSFGIGIDGVPTGKQVSEKNGIIRYVAPEGTDLFIDPNGGKLTATTAKVLFTEIDNTKPFTFSARIKPGFTKDGLYNQGNLVVLANDTLWQNFFSSDTHTIASYYSLDGVLLQSVCLGYLLAFRQHLFLCLAIERLV